METAAVVLFPQMKTVTVVVVVVVVLFHQIRTVTVVLFQQMKTVTLALFRLIKTVIAAVVLFHQMTMSNFSYLCSSVGVVQIFSNS